jgi:hypothetical protein
MLGMDRARLMLGCFGHEAIDGSSARSGHMVGSSLIAAILLLPLLNYHGLEICWWPSMFIFKHMADKQVTNA